MRQNSKLFLALLIAAYLFSWWLWGYREEPEAIIEVAPIPWSESSLARPEPSSAWPEPMGAFYSTNYPKDVPTAVIASVIEEYAHYMWPSTLVTPDEWKMITREHQRENVNPLWPSAIAAHESHLGAHRPAYEKGNLWGIDKSDVDAGLSDLGTLQNGAREVSQILAEYYFDEGRLTFQVLEKKYASQIDPPNGAWAARVQYFYEDLAAELAQQTDPSAPVGIPVAEEDGPRLTQGYSPAHTGHLHFGVDYGANPGGVWLYSTLEGRVVYSGLIPNLSNFAITFTGSVDNASYSVKELDVTGWVVVVENEHWQTFYAHGAEEPVVAAGEMVERGERLMLMGDTGHTFGRHVHYGIRYQLPSGEWRFVKP